MTRTPKTLCALAAVTTAIVLAPAAGAAPTSPTDVPDSPLRVSGLLPGDTVSAFRIADADIDAANNLTYTMAPGLPSAYDTIEEIAAVASDGTAFSQGSAAQNAAAAIAAALTAPEASAVAPDSAADLTLGSGYYLVRVTSTSGQTRVYQNMIVDVTPSVVNGAYAARDLEPIQVKTTDVSINKGDGEAGADSTDAYSVGDSVPFTVTTAVPSYPADSPNATFTVSDAPTAGLAIETATISINGAAAATGADYTLTTSENGYTITYAKDYVLAHPGAPVVITYKAKLTADAYSRSADDLTGNTATVAFNPSPYDAGTATPSDSATVKTYGFVFKKVTPAGQPLPGAAFTVTLANGQTLTSTSDANGYVYFEDLAAGDYTAVETHVPSGYQKAPDVSFQLSAATAASDNPATAAVENNYLVSAADVTDPELVALPITGASGIFLIVGTGTLLLVLGSAMVLRSRKRS